MLVCKLCDMKKPSRLFDETATIIICKSCENASRKRHAEESRNYQREYSLANRDHKIIAAMEWAKANPDKRRKNALNYYYRLADQAILAYGGYRCIWCGIDDPIVLSLDHVENNGSVERKKHNRKGAAFYKWLRDNNYPSGYQVLCMNCNHGKMRNGGVLPPSLKDRCNDHLRQESRAELPEVPGNSYLVS